MKFHAIRPSKHGLGALTVALAGSMGLAQAAAPPTPVTRVYIVEVPPAQDHAFNLGIKAWYKCLRTHGAKRTTYVYDSETGDLTRYLFLRQFSSWGDMDAHDPASKPCMGIYLSQVLPHVGNAFSEVAVPNAKDSYMPGGDPDPAPMVWADVYRIKPGQGPAFEDSMAQFAAAAAKTHWEGHFASSDIEGSGEGGANFVIVWPNKSWADIGMDPTPSAKDMMDSVYGAAAAQSSHQKFLNAIADHWADAWSYDKDLSLIPGK